MTGPATGQRSKTLDGLRGYAAGSVIFFHTILGCDPALVAEVLYRGIGSQHTLDRALLKVVLSIFNGEVAVSVFFVISGIVLLRTLRTQYRQAGSAWLTCATFLLRRFLRIWPMMAVCLVATTLVLAALSVAWPGHVAAPTGVDLRRNLLLAGFPVLGQTWTLFVELAAAPLLLLCFFGIEWAGPRIVLLYAGYALLALVRVSSLLFSSHWLIAGMGFVVAGVAIECGWLASLARSGLRRPVGVLALALLAADLLLVPVVAYKWRTVRFLVTIPLLVGLVYRLPHGWLRQFLEAKPSQELGRLSFSLYLWSVPIQEILLAVAGRGLTRQHPLACGLAIGAATVGVTIPLAHLSERWLERPLIGLGHGLSARIVAAARLRVGRADGRRARDLPEAR